MKKSLTKTLSVLLSLIMAFGIMSVAFVSVDAATSGITGQCSWTYDRSTKTLTISGNGVMGTYQMWEDGEGVDHCNSPFFKMDCVKIVIKNGVTDIGRCAFYQTRFSEVEIPSSVTSIKEYAFSDTEYSYNVPISNGTKINIPNSVTSIGTGAFEGCENLQRIVIPNGIKTIPSYCFKNTNLNSITFPSGLKKIESSAFINCKFTSISIPSGVTEIGSAAFYDNSKLYIVNIAPSVTSIGANAFGFYSRDGFKLMVDGCTIYGYQNTAAERYAKDNNLFFHSFGVAPSTPSTPSTPSSPTVNKAKPSLTVTNKNNGLLNQWSAISGASSYTFYWRNANAGSWASTTVNGTSYNFQGGTPGTLYYFQVIPKFGSSNGTPSNVVSCTYVRNTTLRSTVYNSNGTVTVGWDSASGANGYAIAKKRSTDKSYTYYYVSGTSFTDKNVAGGALYYYQIRPYYSNGKSAAYSDWSNTKTITTLFKPTVTNINTNNINLLNINWNAIKGAKGYKVAFKRSYDSAWNYRTTTSRYYNVPNPTRGATYYVQVCAISGNLAGAYSAVNSHTVAPPLAKPSLTGNTDNTRGYLSWNSISGATGYQIAHKTTDQSSYTYNTTSSTFFYDYNTIKGKTYTYQVRAYSGSTYGPWSNVMTLRPVVDTPIIYTPTYSSNKIRTTWSAVPGAKYYIVSYLWKGESNWTDINVYTTEFTVSNIRTNSTYNIAVKAVGENGKGSKWSETKHVYT